MGNKKSSLKSRSKKDSSETEDKGKSAPELVVEGNLKGPNRITRVFGLLYKWEKKLYFRNNA